MNNLFFIFQHHFCSFFEFFLSNKKIITKTKQFQRSRADMKNAIVAVKNSLLSERAATITFKILRATLGKYFRGDSIIGVKPGLCPKLSFTKKVSRICYIKSKSWNWTWENRNL